MKASNLADILGNLKMWKQTDKGACLYFERSNCDQAPILLFPSKSAFSVQLFWLPDCSCSIGSQYWEFHSIFFWTIYTCVWRWLMGAGDCTKIIGYVEVRCVWVFACLSSGHWTMEGSVLYMLSMNQSLQSLGIKSIIARVDFWSRCLVSTRIHTRVYCIKIRANSLKQFIIYVSLTESQHTLFELKKFQIT
jgi:hypothetical protein